MKKNIRSALLITFLVFGVSIFDTASATAELGGVGKITLVENGWYGEGLALNYTGSNNTCGGTGPNAFAIDKLHSSYKELVALAITAKATASNVKLVLDRGVCLFGGRTKILSINLE